MIGRLRRAPKGALAVAALLATPLFFASLMASSLAIEKPGMENGKPTSPTSATEAKIWLAALVPSLAVVLVGVGATLVRRGVFVAAGAAIVAALLVLAPLGTWQSRHTERYPDGVDLIPKGNSSDIFLRGEWEQTARDTAESLCHWTIVLALTAVAISIALQAYRRRRRPPVPPPPDVASGDAQIAPTAGSGPA